MTLCLIVENPDYTADQAREVLGLVRQSGPVPPEGAHLMIAGDAQPGLRVISVWDSEEAIERFFAARLGPAMEQVGVKRERMTRKLFPIHTLVAGDLTPTPSLA
jgi:hypothetical protein